MEKRKNRKNEIKRSRNPWNRPKWIMFGLLVGVVIATVGSVAALNGWFGGGSIPSDTFTRGLVGYWAFEEGSGNIAYDVSGYANNGTFGTYMVTSTDAWTTGKIGQALQFDGTDDYVDCGTGSSLDITDAITLEAWVKAEAFVSDAGIIGKNYGDSVYPYFLWVMSDGKVRLNSYGVDAEHRWLILSSQPITTGSWYHIVGTFNTANANLYINGEAETPVGVGYPLPTNTKDVWIGKYVYLDSFNGVIDEVRIYNRALSAAEIRYHYNRGGPVAHWKFDEGEGRTVYDSTPNDNDGTLVLAGSATSSAWVSGKYGTALSFDGTDDYIDCGNNSSLQFGTGDFTIGYWGKRISAVGTTEWAITRSPYPGDTDGWRFGLNTSNQLYFRDLEGGVDILSSGTITQNQWEHIVAIRSGTIVTLYLNGVADGTDTVSTDFDDTHRVIIAATPNAAYNVFYDTWTGIIDDIRIYNYARTPEQIRQDYNAGFSTYFK